jgi:hypothetical protein
MVILITYEQAFVGHFNYWRWELLEGIWNVSWTKNGPDYRSPDCGACQGWGEFRPGEACETCNGSGQAIVPDNVYYIECHYE